MQSETTLLLKYFTPLISIREDKKIIDSYVLYIIYDDFTAF